VKDEFVYPERLLIKGRTAVDPDFLGDELLYLRFMDEDSDGSPSGADIRCPDSSVNRGKYSQPEDVLVCQHPKFIKWGIASIRCDQVPSEVLDGSDPPKLNHLRIEHAPQGPPFTPDKEENWSHTEIRVYADGSRKYKIPSSLVKRKIRQRIAEKLIVLKRPETR
jgi:hypothetical protein